MQQETSPKAVASSGGSKENSRGIRCFGHRNLYGDAGEGEEKYKVKTPKKAQGTPIVHITESGV